MTSLDWLVKHITVNYMMAKDSVKKRLSGESRDGLSFTEFTYQLLQGYDFLYLFEKFGVKLQLGGNDQWGKYDYWYRAYPSYFR